MNCSYPKNIEALTSLRFFAAYYVVMYHYLVQMAEVGFPPISAYPVISHGYLGVDFFFILSGFILSHAYKGKSLLQWAAIKRFYIYRLARIYPVHIFLVLFESIYILFFTAVGQIDGYHNHTPLSLFHTVTLTHAWGVGPWLCYNCPSWSLSAEWFMYLVFPFVVVTFFKTRTAYALAMVVGLFILCYFFSSMVLEKPLNILTVDFGVLRIIPEFFLGMLIYKIYENKVFYYHKPKHTVWSLLLVCLGTLLDFPDVLLVFMFSVIILQFAEQSRQGVNSLLRQQRFIHLGEISYSVYLLHVPLLQFLLLCSNYIGLSEVSVLLVWLSCFVTVILLANLIYQYIESPARFYIRKRITAP